MITLLLFAACQNTRQSDTLLDGEVVEIPPGEGWFVGESNPDITTFSQLSSIQVGDLVITEVMHSPLQSQFDSYGEWIELYNASSEAIDLNGLVVSSSNNTGLTFENSLILESGEYVVLGTTSNTNKNGGITFDGLYSSASIRHGINDDLSIGFDAVIFDTVSWTRDLAAVTDGRSFAADGDDLDASLNDSEFRWYAGQSVYGDGDYGTPGLPNLPIYMGNELNAGDLVITEIMHNPTQVSDGRGEWFEVVNQTAGIVQLYGLSVASAGDNGFTADSNAWLPVGEYGVFGAREASSVNGGVTVDDAYSFNDFTLGQTDSITLSSSNGIVDEVSYNKFSWGRFDGVTLNLSPVATDSSDNDIADFWCESTTVYGEGDFGTPGSANIDCSDIDYDGDGITLEEGDCDDENALASSGDDPEVCDGVDNDCDGLVDDDDDNVVYTTDNSWYLDVDGDGYGGLYSIPVVQCSTPIGGMDNPYVNNALDCDDLDATTVNDMDCDGVLTADDCDDFDATTVNDMDCDGVLTADDCDDFDPTTVNDMDCDGVLTADDCDDFDALSTIIAEDMDCDGVLTADDCDDADATTVNDMDCDGVLTADDCDDLDSGKNYLIDVDFDGYSTCDDCNDLDATIYPSATEIWYDGLDTDCSGGSDYDQDGDGEDSDLYGGTDCDDLDSGIFAGAYDVPEDGIDQDCDGSDAAVCYLTSNCDQSIELNSTTGIDFVEIPAGFDPLGRYELTNDFLMMSTEVTQSMFLELMGYPHYYGKARSNATYGSFGEGDDYPAYNISFGMAMDYANQLTEFYNLTYGGNLDLCYSCTDSLSVDVSCTEAMNPYQCTGFRLPTEAEWEYAARAGTTGRYATKDGGGNLGLNTQGDNCGTYSCYVFQDWTQVRIFDGVDNPLLTDYCHTISYPYTTQYGTIEVAKKLPNAFDLYDIQGNVSEYAITCRVVDPTTPELSGLNPYCGLSYGLKGGNWTRGQGTENTVNWYHTSHTTGIDLEQTFYNNTWSRMNYRSNGYGIRLVQTMQ